MRQNISNQTQGPHALFFTLLSINFGSSGSKPFIVEAAELIKSGIIFKAHFGSSGSNP